ncbi:MAG: magnesium transporter CorA family protein [Thermodesulfobacteriota bacterium]
MLKPMQICEGKIAEGTPRQCHILVYVNPDEAEKRYLVEDLGIDEHTLNSALDPDELARMEFEPNHLALIIKRPKSYSSVDNFQFKVGSIGLFVFTERLVIVLAEDIPLFEGRQFIKVNSMQDVVLKLIYRSIFHFEEHLKVINACSEQIEGEISKAMENRHLLNLFTLEKCLVYYLNAISSNSRVIEKLRVNAERVGLTPENLELLDDVAIENRQCREQAEIYSQVLASLMDARASVVGNNLNVLMKRLNIVMIALMLPTLWFSLFSMNVPIPFQHSGLAFWLILVTSIMLVGLLLGLLWKFKRW